MPAGRYLFLFVIIGQPMEKEKIICNLHPAITFDVMIESLLSDFSVIIFLDSWTGFYISYFLWNIF